jgi:integrase
MPRRKTIARWEPIPRRSPGTGSLSRSQQTGDIRARLPQDPGQSRTSRKFGPYALAEATAWLDGELARRQSGATFTPATQLADWAGHWLATTIVPFRAPATAKKYRVDLEKLRPIWHKPLGSLRPSDFQVTLGALAHLAPDTIRDAAGVWQRCLGAAVEDDLIAKNPTRRLTLPTAPKRVGRRGWTAREIELLWGAIRDHRFEAAYALILGCGLRIGEVLGLHWADVDLRGQRAYIKPQYTNGQWRDLPKGQNPHWIPLPIPVVAALIRHHDRQPSGTLLVMVNPGTGKPYARSTVHDALRVLTADLKIRDLTLHAGRHGLATFLLDAGIPPPVIADMLGHANASITLSTYTAATEDGTTRAVELMNRLLGGPEASE